MLRRSETAEEPDVFADRECLSGLGEGRRLTLVGAVGALFIAVVAAVVVSIAGPVLWDAAAAVALELHAGTGVTAACFIAVVSTVIIYTQTQSIDTAVELILYTPSVYLQQTLGLSKKKFSSLY